MLACVAQVKAEECLGPEPVSRGVPRYSMESVDAPRRLTCRLDQLCAQPATRECHLWFSTKSFKWFCGGRWCRRPPIVASSVEQLKMSGRVGSERNLKQSGLQVWAAVHVLALPRFPTPSATVCMLLRSMLLSGESGVCVGGGKPGAGSVTQFAGRFCFYCSTRLVWLWGWARLVHRGTPTLRSSAFSRKTR